MKARWIERGLWGATALMLATAIGRTRTKYDLGQLDQPPVLPVPDLSRPSSDALLDAVGDATAADLFRKERESLDESAIPPATTASAPAASTKPQLVLRGLIGGSALEALVEGIPGVEGAALLRIGDSLAGIRLRAVRRDTAILVGKDTTWKLTVRRLWETK
jgi:hypothetical protein